MTIVLFYATLVSLILLLSSGFSLLFKLSTNTLSFLQHFAAGVIFSAVAVELIPKLLASPLKWDIAIGFLIGLISMMILRKVGETQRSSSRGLVFGFGIDLWIDGILIALSFAAAAESGLIVTIALCLEVSFLMFALIPTLKNRKASLLSLIITSLVLAFMIPFGTLVGILVIEQLPEAYFLATLAFGVSALLFLVTEELLVEAHEERDTIWSSAAFFFGFLLILLL